MGQDNGHCAFCGEVLEAVQQKCKVGGGFWGQAVVLEAYIIAQCIREIPAVTEGWIGHHCIKIFLFCRVGFAQHIPVVEQGVAVKNLELGIFHSVQQHVHARKVVGALQRFLRREGAIVL